MENRQVLTASLNLFIKVFAVEVNSRLRQGRSLSPTLFNTYWHPSVLHYDAWPEKLFLVLVSRTHNRLTNVFKILIRDHSRFCGRPDDSIEFRILAEKAFHKLNAKIRLDWKQ